MLTLDLPCSYQLYSLVCFLLCSSQRICTSVFCLSPFLFLDEWSFSFLRVVALGRCCCLSRSCGALRGVCGFVFVLLCVVGVFRASASVVAVCGRGHSGLDSHLLHVDVASASHQHATISTGCTPHQRPRRTDHRKQDTTQHRSGAATHTNTKKQHKHKHGTTDGGRADIKRHGKTSV